MEEIDQKNIKRIVLIGAESTGKSEIAAFLAKEFNTVYVPEYARAYIENLDRHYTYKDVEHIAKKQVELEDIYSRKAKRILIYDTYLIITKIWFKLVYNKVPKWIEEKLNNCKIDYYLLCNNDIPWVEDSVRENGGEMRDKLFDIYKSELIHYGFKFDIVVGEGKARLNSAHQMVNNFLKAF